MVRVVVIPPDSQSKIPTPVTAREPNERLLRLVFKAAWYLPWPLWKLALRYADWLRR